MQTTNRDWQQFRTMLVLATLVIVATLGLVGCENFGGLKVPDQDGKPILTKVEEGIAEGYARLRAARRTINTLEKEKIITNAQMRSFHVEADKVRLGLDTALSADIDVDRGAHLESAMVLLRLLRAELVKRQVKG